MERSKPLDQTLVQSYLEATMTILEESIARTRSAKTMQQMTHDPSFDFQRAFFETVIAINQLLGELGGMPITYTDEQTNVVTQTTVFAYRDYDVLSDRWTVIATDHGQPPAPFIPIREVTLTTPELRSGYEEARA